MLSRFLAFCALAAAETCLNGTECEEANLLSYAAEEEWKQRKARRHPTCGLASETLTLTHRTRPISLG